jgi:anaerobic magnesium-protoporphyrin IX monomethyl ester cyclase
MPYPAWDLIPVKKYFGKPMGDQLYHRPEIMTVVTSRSCPYSCIFCHNLFGRGFRARSATNVVDEIRTLHERYGVREIHVQDDIFNLDMDRAKEICRMIIENGPKVFLAFPNGLRGDIMDDELIDLLYRAGARRVCYAVESGSLRIQKMLKKNLNLEKLAVTVRKTAAKGILIKGFFMIGFPTETHDEMMQTIRFARDNDFDTAGFNRVIPTKGTELYEMARELGMKAVFDYDDYSYDYSNINLSAVDNRTLEKTIRKAYFLFVAKPKRLLRLLWLFPRKRRIFPYFFLLLLIKMFWPKRPGRREEKPIKRRLWRIRH